MVAFWVGANLQRHLKFLFLSFACLVTSFSDQKANDQSLCCCYCCNSIESLLFFQIVTKKNIWTVLVFGFWSLTDVTKQTFLNIFFSNSNQILFIFHLNLCSFCWICETLINKMILVVIL